MTDKRASKIIADLLSSTLMRAYDENRKQLYCWEVDACMYLDDCLKQGYSMNAWTAHFVRLNAQAIRQNPYAEMNFNLRDNPIPA
jgi:hypothetical protein